MKMKLHLVVTTLLIMACTGIANAEQHRSEAAKNDFKHSHPCPANGNDHGPCPGYVIDHEKPLACGGADDPSNMQWQTTAESKAKDKWERKGCDSGLTAVKGRRSSSSSGGSRKHRSAGSSYSGGSSSGSNSGYYTGPRGGCYTLSGSGKKRYVDHSFCS